MAQVYYRQGSAAQAKPKSNKVTIHWEDGSESQVTEDQAKEIRASGERLKQSVQGHGRSMGFRN